jgi:hypothetical protein
LKSISNTKFSCPIVTDIIPCREMDRYCMLPIGYRFPRAGGWRSADIERDVWTGVSSKLESRTDLIRFCDFATDRELHELINKFFFCES